VNAGGTLAQDDPAQSPIATDIMEFRVTERSVLRPAARAR
jgi:hypothetical protein